jgi:hypothetical protein
MGGADGSELAGARGERWSPVKLLRSLDEAGFTQRSDHPAVRSES